LKYGGVKIKLKDIPKNLDEISKDLKTAEKMFYLYGREPRGEHKDKLERMIKYALKLSYVRLELLKDII